MMYISKLFGMSLDGCTKMPTLFPFFSKTLFIYCLYYLYTVYTVHYALVSHKTDLLLYKKLIRHMQPKRVLKVFFHVHSEKSNSI